MRTALISVVAAGFVCGGVFVLWISNFKLPDLEGIQGRKVAQSTKIYDRTGTVLLYDVHEDIKRTVVPFTEISRQIKNATVAIEDAEFYQHRGIRPVAILRAVLANLFSLRFSQGGSTITQQVVKNTVLTGEKQISRKLKEWVLALKLERVMDKESILALYLNESPYGGNIYGIQEAAQAYFGKKASEVTLAEAAYLAALPNAPTYYSPYGNNREKLEARKELVLERMFEGGFITKEERGAAQKEVVVFKPQATTGINAPHFVLFVKEYLESRYGPRAVSDEGLKVITTLDYALQQKAEEVVRRHALENERKFNAENAGLVAIDPKTGGILAMVGSRGYFDKEIDGNFNIALAKRQPGSSFKPFVYATALTKGYTPETVVFDVRTEFSTYCNPDGTPINPQDADRCYQPENYDQTYRGPVTMREALAQSINVPAIKFLYLAGLKDSIQVAQSMGITTLVDPGRYGLTLVLGGGEVSLLDMTSSYGVFANGGTRSAYYAVEAVYDREGKGLERFQLSPELVLEKNVALQITNILSDNKARAPAFGELSYLHFPQREVAVKTGTTNDYRDAWIIGYTPSLSVGAWAGNNDNSPMEKKVAGFIVAPLWHEFMEAALASTSLSERFERPGEQDISGLKPVMRGFWQGNVAYTIDGVSGKLATAMTPKETRVDKVVTDVHTILAWVDRNSPLGPPPQIPSSDPQYTHWEYGVRKWVVEKGVVEQTVVVIPTAADDVHVPENAPVVSVLGIDPSRGYDADSAVYVFASGQGRYPLTRVDFYLNDVFVGSGSRPPFATSFVPSSFESVGEKNHVRAVGYDSVFNRGEAAVELNLLFK